MIDVERMTITAVAQQLDVCFRTVEKAYDAGHPDKLAAAAVDGEPPRRTTNSRIGLGRKQRIRELVEAGSPISAIVAETGCSSGTAMRFRMTYLHELIKNAPPGTSPSDIARKCGCREGVVRREMAQFE